MAELTQLNIKINGDSTQANAAIQKLILNGERLQTSLSKVNKNMMRFGNVSSIATRKAIPQLQNVGKAANTARFHSANLFAQFQDIGVMIASGQSPFILAAQQGSQISQVMLALKKDGASTFQALRAAALSFVSPLNLITVGAVAAVAVIGQWGLAALSSRENTVSLSKAMKELSKSTGEVNDELERMRRGFETVEQLNAARAIDELNEKLEEELAFLDDIKKTQDAIGSDWSEEIQAQEAVIALLRQHIANQQAILDKNVEVNTELETTKEHQAYIEKLSLRVASAIDQAAVNAHKLAINTGLAVEEMEDYLTWVDEVEARMDKKGMSASNRPKPAPREGEGPFAGTTTTKRGGSRTDPFKQDWEQLQDFLRSEIELEQNAFNERQTILEEALDRRLITQQQYLEMERELNEQHQRKMAEIDVWRHGTTLQKTDAFLGSMADIFASGNQQMFEISKKFGAAQALVAAFTGAAEALKLPFPQNLMAYAKVLATGLGAVQAIKGAQPGGSTSGGGGATAASGGGSNFSQAVAITLEGSETAMYNKSQIRDLINAINDAVDGGAIVRLA